MKIAVFAVAALLTGCVQITHINGPDGRPAMVLRCGMQEDQCYKKAGELCPDGYDMVGGSVGMAIVPMRNGGMFGGSQHSLVISCK